MTGASPTPTSINAGSYAVVGTISDTLYQGSASGTLVIAKADQTIAFSGPASQPFSATPIALSATANLRVSPCRSSLGQSLLRVRRR